MGAALGITIGCITAATTGTLLLLRVLRSEAAAALRCHAAATAATADRGDILIAGIHFAVQWLLPFMPSAAG